MTLISLRATLLGEILPEMFSQALSGIVLYWLIKRTLCGSRHLLQTGDEEDGGVGRDSMLRTGKDMERKRREEVMGKAMEQKSSSITGVSALAWAIVDA